MAKKVTWIEVLIEVYNELGGTAHYKDVYPLAIDKYRKKNGNIAESAEEIIRRTVLDHVKDSNHYKEKEIFYKAEGNGEGVWTLIPSYNSSDKILKFDNSVAYNEGVEGITKEAHYLRKSRNATLTQIRKEKDDYKCQACGYRIEVNKDQFIIDVHHLNPIGKLQDCVVTTIDHLICLCPNCHRIAHSSKDKPLSIEGIKEVNNRNSYK